jgi:hypothetical protein
MNMPAHMTTKGSTLGDLSDAMEASQEKTATY